MVSVSLSRRIQIEGYQKLHRPKKVPVLTKCNPPDWGPLTTLSTGRVLLWDAVSGQQRQSLEGPGEAVNWLQWHPRGNVLLAGSEDFTAWLWNAQNGACMHVRYQWALAECTWTNKPFQRMRSVCPEASEQQFLTRPSAARF